MKYVCAFLLVVLLLLPATRLRAQNILMPAGNGVTASYQGCGGSVYDQGGPTTGYTINQDSRLVLQPLVPVQRVALSFTSFGLELNSDFLEIYDGPNLSAPLLARLTGNQGLGQVYTANNAQGVLTLRFTSDNSINPMGFAATLSCLTPPGATAGNVGVGTAAPVEKLEVGGVIYSNQGGVRFPDGTLQTSAAPAPDNLGNHTATRNLGLNGNWLSNDGSNTGLRLDNGGRLGINTATPDRPLTIQGNGTSNQLISLRNNAGTNKWHWNLAGGGLNLAESNVTDYRLFVKEGGRVGIGTGDPQQALDVAGTVQAEDFVYPAAQERVLTVSPFAFTSTSAAAPVNISGSGAALLGITLSGSGLGYAVAPVALPVGAEVTKVEFWALDNDATANTATQVRLVQYTPTAGGPVTISGTLHASLTGSTNATRTASVATSMTISPNASYYVEYNANRSSSCILQGVRLTYTVTQAD